MVERERDARLRTFPNHNQSDGFYGVARLDFILVSLDGVRSAERLNFPNTNTTAPFSFSGAGTHSLSRCETTQLTRSSLAGRPGGRHSTRCLPASKSLSGVSVKCLQGFHSPFPGSCASSKLHILLHSSLFQS